MDFVPCQDFDYEKVKAKSRVELGTGWEPPLPNAVTSKDHFPLVLPKFLGCGGLLPLTWVVLEPNGVSTVPTHFPLTGRNRDISLSFQGSWN